MSADDATLLAVRDVTVRFDGDEGAVHAVDRVSFDVTRGEVLAIVGESGCGKSVTTMSLLGLLPQSASVVGLGALQRRHRADRRERRRAAQDPRAARSPSSSRTR